MKRFNKFDENGIFTESEECYENPVRKGNYIKPDLSTDLELPPYVEKKWWKFVNNEWLYIDDFRGDIYYNEKGIAFLIDSLDEIPASWSATPPQISVDDLKAKKNIEIKQSASSAIVSGIECAALGELYLYPTTMTDQINLNGLITASLLPNSGDIYKFWCADKNGVWARRNHTKLQLLQVGLTVADHVKFQQEKYERLLKDINFSTAENLALIVW